MESIEATVVDPGEEAIDVFNEEAVNDDTIEVSLMLLLSLFV